MQARIPLGCPDVHEPCAHPEVTQSAGGILDVMLGLLVVAALCALAFGVWWLWRTLRDRP
jgi:hypothetical protein